ncbi:unnamed protein product [Alopecurus aequalis]
MSAPLLFRSAGRALGRSIPQGSLHRRPVRRLSGGVGRIEPSQHSPSKPNMEPPRICRAAESQKEWAEFASDVRVVRDKLRVLEQTYKEAEKWDKRRERMLLCASGLFVAFFVFAQRKKSVENQVM